MFILYGSAIWCCHRQSYYVFIILTHFIWRQLAPLFYWCWKSHSREQASMGNSSHASVTNIHDVSQADLEPCSLSRHKIPMRHGELLPFLSSLLPPSFSLPLSPSLCSCGIAIYIHRRSRSRRYAAAAAAAATVFTHLPFHREHTASRETWWSSSHFAPELFIETGPWQRSLTHAQRLWIQSP